MKKKSIKKVAKNAVIGTLCSSILASTSCTKYSLEGNIYGEFAPNEEMGIKMIDLYETNLSNTFYREAEAVQRIIEELMNDPSAVEKLLNDPDAFYQEKQIAFQIELSPAQKQLFKAFADEKAISAIRDHDINGFIRICCERGYIAPQLYESVNVDELRKYFQSDEDFDLFIKNYNLEANTKSLLLAVPIVAVAIGLYLVGAITIAVYGTTAVWEVAVIGKETIKKWFRDDGNNYDPCIRLFQDNEMPSLTEESSQEFIEEQARSVLNEIRDVIDPNYTEQAYKIIKNQLIGYYKYNQLIQ